MVPPPPLASSYRELLNDESRSPTHDRLANYLNGYEVH